MTNLSSQLRNLLENPVVFASSCSGLQLRTYQRQVAEAITRSVIKGLGQTFVVIFPRQSGKNELQAQIETYLLVLFSQLDAEMVKVSPTWKPQSLNAMRRLERVLKRNCFSQSIHWYKEQGYIYRVGRARIYFLSGSPTANIVGATASLLLECDEAQDVTIAKWDKEINPMAASTNATRVFWGTAWTSQTLLAREMRAALELEKQDGIRRVFTIDANTVGKEVPAYKTFVQNEIQRLGANHPFVLTQYFSREIDAESGMFPASRSALMHGSHPATTGPLPNQAYAFAIDVAGSDEGTTAEPTETRSTRDSTALTIFEIDLSTLADPLIKAPTYRVRNRFLWTNVSLTRVYQHINALMELWKPARTIVDATGVGAGLASWLYNSWPGVIPFTFSQKSKSDLGWGFIAVIESGRFKDHAPDPGTDPYQVEFFRQLSFCQMEIGLGPNRLMTWGVQDGARDAATGELVHDDLVISAALCAQLDEETWGTAQSDMLDAPDIFKDLSF